MEFHLDRSYLCLQKLFFQLHHFQNTWRRNPLSGPQPIKCLEQIYYPYQAQIDHQEHHHKEIYRFEPVHNFKGQSNAIWSLRMDEKINKNTNYVNLHSKVLYRYLSEPSNSKRTKFLSFLRLNHFIHHISQNLVGLKAVGLSTYICATLIALLKTWLS